MNRSGHETTAATAHPSARHSRPTRRAVVSWLMAFVLVFAQTNLPLLPARAQGQQPDPAEDLARLERLFDALEAAARAIPRDTFDPVAVLMQTDLTPEGLHAWVRDHTFLVPYRGVLRGPVGVLMDRVGNSLDRALLLQELLRLVGYDTRLARAELSEEQAREVLAGSRPLPFGGALPQRDDADATSELADYAARFGLDDGPLTAMDERVREQERILQAALELRTEEQASFLLRSLGAPAGDGEAEWASQTAAMRDHWWVQYASGGGWIDLDPTFAESAPGTIGTTLAATQVTYDDVPDFLRHTVQIRVILECIEAGVPAEHLLLESPPLPPADLLGDYVALEHVPVHWPQAPAVTEPSALQALVLAQEHWVPVLRLGGQVILDRGFTSSCEVGPAPASWLGGVDAAFGAAGAAFDPPGLDANAGTAATVTALWLEYVTGIPDLPERIDRRQIFDRRGPAARISGARPAGTTEADAQDWRLSLAGGTQILLLPSQLSPEYAAHVIAERILANRSLLLAAVQEPDPAIDEITKQLQPLSSELLDLALVRQRWQALAGPVYLSRPNILTFHRRLLRTPDGELGYLMGFDIVANFVDVDARAGASPFEVRMKHGVLDTNAEALLAALVCGRTAGAPRCTSTANAAEALHGSLRRDAPWRLARSAADLAELPWPADALAHVRQQLAEGYVVVVPERSVGGAVTWWRIDGQRGETLGIGESGWGTAGEYAVLKNAIALIGTGAFCVAGAYGGPSPAVGTIFCILGATGAAVGLVSGGVTGVIFVTAGVLLGGIGGLGIGIE